MDFSKKLKEREECGSGPLLVAALEGASDLLLTPRRRERKDRKDAEQAPAKNPAR
jgi:hypothetical protein